MSGGRRAGVTDTDWGRSPWHADPGLARTNLREHVEVAVIGAGLTGVSAAYHLARRGLGVAVLDAGPVGAGASGRTGGLVLEGTAAGNLDGVTSCIDALRHVVDEAGIACDLRLGGVWELEHRRGPSPCAALWPDGETMLCIAGTEPGGSVDAGALLRGLAVAAHRAGAAIHERVAVQAIEPGGTILLRTADGTMRAEHVIVALGAYVTSLVPLPVPITPALTLALATAPLSDAALADMGLGARTPFYTTDLPYLWGRVVADGRLILGAGLVHPADGDVRTLSLGDTVVREALCRLETRVRGLHPTLARIEVTARWGGPIAFRRGGVPIVSRLPGLSPAIVCAAYAGHGIALGVRIGQLLAEAIVDGVPLPAWGEMRPVGSA
jgi:gamma-glutamylputrescine oxidase